MTRLIDADEFRKHIDGYYPFDKAEQSRHGIADVAKSSLLLALSKEPTVDAIVCDDNFGFAGYIIENDKYGIRVEESWNKDLTDEELMAVMCGVIQDVLADERLKRLWESATEMAEFLGGYDGFNQQRRTS